MNGNAFALAFFCWFVIAGVAIDPPVLAQEPLARDLFEQKLLKEALDGNRDLEALRYTIDEAKGRVVQAGLFPNPEFETARTTDRFFNDDGSYDLSVGLRQRFPIAGRIRAAERVSFAELELAKLELAEAKRALGAEVLIPVRQAAVLKKKIAANDELKSFLRNLITISARRLEVAEASETDVNLATIELQKLEIASASFEREIAVAEVALRRLLGRDAGEALTIPPDEGVVRSYPSLAELTAEAIEKRPDRKIAEKQIARAEATLRLGKAERWEDWSVGVGVERNKEVLDTFGADVDTVLGGSVTIPLPLFNRNQGTIASASSALQRSKASLAALDLRIGAEVESAYRQIGITRASLVDFERRSIPLARQNVKLLEKGYSDGIVPITSLIQAEQQLIDVRQSALDLLSELRSAETALQVAVVDIEPFTDVLSEMEEE